MKTRYFLLLAAMGLLASCTKEMDTPESTGGKTVLTVGIGSETRTYMGETTTGTTTTRKVYWSPKDQIAVNGTPSDPLPDDLADETASASFSFDGIITAPYNLLYPASIYKDASHVTLPAVQAYKADGFAKDMFPMAGTGSSAADLSISHLCAILKISVLRATGNEADADKIVSVRFKGRNNEKVSGDFEIDYATPQLVPAAKTSDVDGEVRVAKSLATSTDNAVVYYLVVPARTYANGFDIIVQDEQGHIMTQSKTTEWVAVPGKQSNMPEFAFVPTGTELGIEISNAQELIDFAEAYNAEEYKALDSQLIATVTDNIVFDATSSAAFNATGGIGTNDNGRGDTNYFNGVFNGNGHTISGLEATVPVFAYTGGNGTVKDLTLASTCTFTVGADDPGSYHGALVGRNKGTVLDCTSDADVIVNNIQNVENANQCYGGLVGYNPEGTIEGCTMTGDITCAQTGQSITKNNAYIGGVVGYQSTGGTIKDCTFSGNISISDGTTYGGITANKVYFYVGGILGRAENAIITGCTAGIDGGSGSVDVRGKMVPAIGGIVGWIAKEEDSEIQDCHNYLTLSFASNGTRANTTPCRIGGIAARSAAPINDCTNSGALSSACNSTTLNLGGIVAEGTNVDNCTNNMGGTISRSNADLSNDQANRYIYIGGIMGLPTAACDITGSTNHASVTCNPIGASTNTTVDLGGIVGGENSKQIDIIGCANDGEIQFNNDNAAAVATARSAIGGILGFSNAEGTTVKECSNEGKVWCNNNVGGSYGNIYIGGTIGGTAAECSVTDCTNSGEILCQNPGNAISAYVDLGGIVGYAGATITIAGTTEDATLNSGPVTVVQASPTALFARNTQGGILGYGKGNDTRIVNCKNTNKIYCSLSGVKADNRPSYTGGIAGLLANMTYTNNAASKLAGISGLEIGHCNNTGEVNSANYNNKAGNKNSPFAGGIAGLICGTSGDGMGAIHDCSVGTQTVYVYRGTGGGLIGYANYCTLTDNTTSANMSGANANVNGVGGIVGRLFDSAMTDCTFSGKIAKAKNIGGLVYTLSEQTNGSTITGCKVNGATLTTGTAADHTAAAVLVSITDDKTNTISNCGVKGTLDGAAISLSSNMITTVGGSGTTVSGTYLLP